VLFFGTGSGGRDPLVAAMRAFDPRPGCKVTEPYLLAPVATGLPGRLFRVSRPGRGAHGSQERVGDEAIGAWVDSIVAAFGVPEVRAAGTIHYVCLLGRKRKGRAEVSGFYEARAPWETSSKPLFEDLLNQVADGRARFRVHHFPTVDGEPLPPRVAGEVHEVLLRLLGEGALVVVGCSAAERRSVEVIEKARWLGPSVG